MGIVRQGIEKQIGASVPRQVVCDRHTARKHDTRGVETARRGLPAQVGLGFRIVLQQPEHAVGHPPEDSHPAIEHRRHDLVVVVEAAKDESILRQSQHRPVEDGFGDAPLAVIGLIAIRQINHLLLVAGPVSFRNHPPVRDDIVHVSCAHGAGETEIVHLDRGRAPRKDVGPALAEIAVQIDENVDLPLANGGDRPLVAQVPDADESMNRSFDTSPRLA